MPRLQIESVILVSSEDPLYPAKNLLSSAIGNDVKKWINQKNGEKQAYVVFKLKEKSQITNLTVGNQNSSFIEVLVGDDSMSEKEYQVLLPATEILTLREARGGANKAGVHFFAKDDLNKETVQKKWSRVKVVCSQPYDPHCRYGLSCFVLKSICDSDTNGTDESPKRGDRTIPVEDKNALSDDTKDDVNSWKQDMLKRLDASTSQPSTSSLPFNRIKLNKQPIPDSKNDRQKSPKKHSSDEREAKRKEKKKGETTTHRDPDPPAEPERPKVDFNKILHDVRFSLSGYENPLRSEIRNKGLEMGAKYSNDWDSRCTHLICAFINTPKFNKVQGQGKIVTRDWIEQCHSKKRRLPWRKFALDTRDRQQPISEEDEDDDDDDKDEKEKKNKAKVDRRRRLPSESSSDTEDEIQRVQARKQRITPKKAVPNGTAQKRKQYATKTRAELYDADTDVSEEEEEDEFGGDNSDADPDFKLGSQEERSEHDDSFVVVDDDDDVGDSETQGETESENDEPKKKKPRQIRMGKPVRVKKERKKGDVHNLSLVSRVAAILASDSDEDMNRPDTTNLELPPLPQMPPHTYYIAEDEKGVSRDYLIRYIRAFDGTILDELSYMVDYAITDSKSIAEKIIEEHPSVVTVKPEWIWDSYETDMLLPTENYHLS